MADEQESIAIPRVEERLATGKREVETGRVRVRTEVDERHGLVREQLSRDQVEVDRIPIEAEVDAVPPIREEGDTLVIPVVEERLMVRKALFVVEEIRLRRRVTTEEFAQPVTLRRQRAVVERERSSGEASNTTHREES